MTVSALLECSVENCQFENYFAPKNEVLKQGCNIGPSLFKIFIDELAKSVEQSDRESGSRDRARTPERKKS